MFLGKMKQSSSDCQEVCAGVLPPAPGGLSPGDIEQLLTFRGDTEQLVRFPSELLWLPHKLPNILRTETIYR